MNENRTFKLTPMYEQYLNIKEQYPGALLFYRMGDFYELFFEDAEIAAKELQLTLTSRSKDDAVPMCGVPWHAVEGNISQLVEKGYKVAVCDQIEDPRSAKGLVKRAVTRVVTSGTTLEDSNLRAKEHNYLGALYWNENDGTGGFAWVDASTGTWSGLQSSKEPELWQWVYKMAPRELLLAEDARAPETLKLQDTIQVVRVPFRSHFEPKQALIRVLAAQRAAEPGALGLDKRAELAQACGALVAYLAQAQQQEPVHLGDFRPLDLGRFLVLDEITERNLELFRRLDGRRGPGTLWQVLDMTVTPMGGRLLEERLRYPWRELAPINATQEVLAHLLADPDGRQGLRQALEQVYDLERLSTRIFVNRCVPRDLAALRDSLVALPKVKQAAQSPEGVTMPPALFRMLRQWDNLSDAAELLERALRDSLPIQVTDGGLFRQGYNKELDELLELVEHGESLLQELLKEEQEVNNLPKLKLGFNRVFGYYFELSKTQLPPSLPEHFQRRQTMVNGERFITPKLKELEDKLLTAAEERKTLEYRLFQQLRDELNLMRPRILYVAQLLAQLDFWQCLAEIAERNGWVRPDVHEGQDIVITEGRHPVVEKVVGKASFIPNDLLLDDTHRLLLITGPNMAGKSTVLRQTAILSILAQMGSYVPATKARMGLVDRIFSRVGASDNLAQGQSTFMVEMMETARILRQATKRSLVILDEIGRGTSTFDGMALAWAVAEELARRAGGQIRTLFATHYHELTALEGRIPGVINMNIAIREWNGEIVFLRRLIPGPSDKSYGIEVARLAGVPAPVVQRAREILEGLEKTKDKSIMTKATAMLLPGLETAKEETKAISPLPHPLLAELAALQTDALSPLEALNLLVQWKKQWSSQ